MKNHKKTQLTLGRCGWVLATALGLVTSAQADEEAMFFGQLPLVASVSRLPQQRADAPAAVTVIDRDMIRASGARDISDLFRMVPGFQTFATNTDAPRVTYHGLTDRDQSSRVQVMIDGRSVFSPVFDGGVNWLLLPVALDDIERIEVVRGNNSTSAGANAFQAMINIITVDPLLAQGLSISATHGNQGVRDYSLRQGGRLGESGAYRMRFQTRDDNGLANRDNWQDSYRSRLVDFRGDLAPSDDTALQIGFGRIETESLAGRTTDTSNPIHPVQGASTYLQASWQKTQSSERDFRLRYAYTRDEWRDSYRGVSAVGANSFSYPVGAEMAVGQRHELEARQRFDFGAWRGVLGGSYRLDSLYWPQYLYGVNQVDRRIARVFSNLEWKPTHWLTGNLGVAHEDDSLGGQLPSYRAGANFHLDSENTLRITAAYGTRAGGILEYRGDGRLVPDILNNAPIAPAGSIAARMTLGNPDLAPERFESVELGYLGEWRKLNASLDIRLFHEHVPNRWYRIGRVLPAGYCGAFPSTSWCIPNTRVEQAVALQDVYIRGLEYEWRWQPLERTRMVVTQSFTHVTANYLPGVTSDPANVSVAAGTNLATNLDQLSEQSAPARSSSVLLMQSLPGGLEFSLLGLWVSQMKWTTNSLQLGYHRVDGRLAYPFRIGPTRGEVAVVVQSINGAHGEFNADNSGDERIVDRRQWVTLRLDF